MDRLQRGHHLFGVEENGKSVCSQWVETKEGIIPYFDMRLRLPEDTVYVRTSTPHVNGGETRDRAPSSGDASARSEERWISAQRDLIDPTNTASIRLADFDAPKYQVVHYIRVWFLKTYRIVKYEENLQKRYFGVFKSPTSVWRAFL